MARGRFILLEGCDRAGKSTQCEMLVAAMKERGHSVELCKFPDRTTTIGQMIHAYLTNTRELDDRAIHLLFSANRWEAMQAMKRKLQQGIHLVVDRYAYSGVAFSTAKGLDLTWCKNPDRGLVRPDLTFFLDLPTSEAEKRGGFGEERYEKRELQERVRDVFLQLKSNEWVIVDACKSVQSMHNELLREVEHKIRVAEEDAKLADDEDDILEDMFM
ncbi:thymidylate kinase-like protein [Gamsiella multidivaricata]|uniref:thymidylate kinase-like protein n=1 Tax=Gamsiella multidivaricata TaxID=101098 RepID=UPI0022202F6A|nr:thymidylate kinase-like protein [Gamsiella multidivaricata]KAI7829503.1 thymidylate kinase-like protein [Gamsiella multidivaricata]